MNQPSREYFPSVPSLGGRSLDEGERQQISEALTSISPGIQRKFLQHVSKAMVAGMPLRIALDDAAHLARRGMWATHHGPEFFDNIN